MNGWFQTGAWVPDAEAEWDGYSAFPAACSSIHLMLGSVNRPLAILDRGFHPWSSGASRADAMSV